MQYWEFTDRHGWVVRDRILSDKVCPICRSHLYHVPPRLLDRLIGLVLPLRRHHRCGTPQCGWKGSL